MVCDRCGRTIKSHESNRISVEENSTRLNVYTLCNDCRRGVEEYMTPGYCNFENTNGAYNDLASLNSQNLRLL